MRRWLAAVVVAVAGSVGHALSLAGTWGLTFELLPNTRIYSSEITLRWGFAPGWNLESESKIYSDGLLRYQNFYLEGGFGELGVSGKIYFHARDVRYQKLWVNAEVPVGGGTLLGSFNHWATAADYTSSDKDRFGPWPCLDVVSWEDAWMFIGREVHVTGPVLGFHLLPGGALILNIGRAFPDPDRFQIYIPAANRSAFEELFGPGFWETWVTKTVCVKGTIKGYRYTTGGPGGGGYSVAEVSITSPAALSVGTCPGVALSPRCPGTTVKWFRAKDYVGQVVYVQGPVASITGPATYHGYANHYRVRIGGGGDVGNRVEVIIPYRPGWPTATTSYTNEVCVQGRITLRDGIAVILPPDLVSTSGSPCCPGGGLPGMFVNWRFRYTLSPWTVTVDFGDCCTGVSFRRLSIAATGLPLCCGLTSDGSFSFAKAGLESVAFTVKGLPLFCCGLVADLSVTFTPDSKKVTLTPKWPAVTGCLTVYGDVARAGAIWEGLVLYGWRVYCWLDRVRLEAGVALDREKMNEASPLSFRSGEWQYLGLAYSSPACCGGDLWFGAEFWFGEGTYLFGLRRIKLSLEVPVVPSVVLFTRGLLDLSRPSPLEYWNVGWELSF